jgi:hypothetical protein
MNEGKVCTKCGEWKPFSEYNKHKAIKDGHYTRCKKCKREEDRLYRIKNKEKLSKKWKEYYEKNKDEYLSKQREKYAQNKDAINEKRREREKIYRENYKEEIRRRHEMWRRKNKDKLKVWQEKWNNSETAKLSRKKYKKSQKGRMNDYKSRLKRRSVKYKVSFTPIERKQILDRDKWKCQICGVKVHDRSTGNWNTPNKANIDHIIPISKGGNSLPNNLQILCRTCNLKKHDNVEVQLSIFNEM